MPRLKALQALTYDGKPVARDEEFDAGVGEARTLIGIRYATADLGYEATVEHVPEIAQLSEETQPQKRRGGRPKGSKNKNTYDRRDMTAE